MTVVGSVEVEVRALVDQAGFSRQVNAQLRRPMETAGDVAGKTMGKHVGESAAHELEKSGARFARSGRLLAGVFTANSAAALGPLQEVADKVELIGSTLESTRTKAGGVLLGIGAAATGIGAFLSTLASREEGALNRLGAVIQATGGNIDDYRGRIEEAVKSGERFGYSGNQTVDALQALTIGLHDPKKAFDELGLAQDIAAAKQIPLASAANLVRQAYNGNTRVLKAFGIQVSGIVDGQKLLTDANKTSVDASAAAAKAQQDYTDKLAIYRDTLKPTLSQQIALKESHDKLLTAQQEQAAATRGVATAQTAANNAGSKGQEVLDQLAKITAGQAAASADTFTGKLKGYGAAIEDNAAKIGGHAGKALIEFGPALAAGGFLIESGLIPKLGRGVAALLGFGGQAVATAAEVEGASVAEVASLDTVVLAIRELQAAMTGIGPAAAAQAVEVGTATTAMDAELAGVGLAAEGAASTAGLAFTSLLGPIGLAAGALTGLIILLNRSAQDAQETANILNGTKTATIALPKRNPVLTLDGHRFLNDGSGVSLDNPYGASGLPAPGDDHGAHRGDPSPYSARGLPAPADDHGAHRGTITHTQTLAEFLAANGLGPTASSALNKALSDVQKSAGDRARAIGKTVTDGIRAHINTVKREISSLTAELKKMGDVRSQAIGQAGSFTSITGLLGDNSLASSGGLVAGLQSRVAAESLFGRNITALSKRGLDKGVIAEILAAGPDQGRAIAAALMQGPDSNIRALNVAEKASRQQAQVLGSAAVTAQFGAGAQAKANAELARLNAQVATLNRQIAAQPALIAKAVDQAQKNARVTSTAKTRTAVAR